MMSMCASSKLSLFVIKPPGLYVHFDKGQNDQPDDPSDTAVDDEAEEVDRAMGKYIVPHAYCSQADDRERLEQPKYDLQAPLLPDAVQHQTELVPPAVCMLS
jgi:hypothetical protein